MRKKKMRWKLLKKFPSRPLDDVNKCSDGVLNSSGECEIVEINDRKTSRSGEWGGKRENFETDDDVIVVSVDDGDHSLNYASDKCRRLLSYSSPKDVVLPLGKRQNEAKGNDTGRNTYDKYKFLKKKENDNGKEMLEGKADLSKCDDVEELYRKGNGFRNCDDKDKTGSTAGSVKSEGEVSPCIVIADSDSEDDTEKGPHWESDPSDLLPSLEWLKLFPEEAFFLAYGLGCVQVWDARKTEVEDEIVKIKEKRSPKQHDYPVSVNSISKKDDSMNSALSPCNLENSDDTLPMVSSCDEAKAMSLEELWNAFRLSRALQSSVPFETSYAVYHHFRSKGWVVKPGIRFGGDFYFALNFDRKLLYKDGPSFYHASYLVVIDSSLPHEGSAITWNTLAGLNRLAENVAKVSL
ncbi:hypothetical protein J437_LFUL016205 [Ladona fulva]|uniref:tRNA-intron lyase n=1 Tax=Ladona fulva TaxID=123851 RepID=A0A8K0P8Q5_LADFU|nr:hypothetical protein J437_LFUL016205 [Ladona fulva]